MHADASKRPRAVLLTCSLALAALLTLGLTAPASNGASGGSTPTGTATEAKVKGKAKSKAKARTGKRDRRAKSRFKLSSRHVKVGQAVKLHGRALPGGRRNFKVVVKGPDGTVVKRKTNRRGLFVKRWRPSKPGVYRLRAFVGHNKRARGAKGPGRRLTVYRPAHASWFGPGFYGNRTACGQILSAGMLGVAHRSMPCGTRLKLRHGKRRVSVRVIDRGPFIPGREFDLTYATKQALGFGDLGTVYSSK